MANKNHYDVAILGAGTAGLSARSEVAKHTDNYVVVDPGPLGKTCARVGCMPSKTLLHLAHTAYQISAASAISPDAESIMSQVRSLRDQFVSSVMRGMQTWQNTHLIKKTARFLNENTLHLGDQQIEADNIIVATGSTPSLPQAWRKYSKHIVDTDTFFELSELPQNIAVVGLGPVGLEIGQALSWLGVNVTGIDPSDSIGGLTDPQLQQFAREHFSKIMQISHNSAEIHDTKEDKFAIKLGEKVIRPDKVLAAMGRHPNISQLGFETIAANLDDNGLPNFDQSTLQVSNKRIFLAGDVNAMRPLLHEAADDGHIAGYNACQQMPSCFNRRTPLAITFTSPGIALVGDDFQALTKNNSDFVIGESSFESQGRAIIMDKAAGKIHIYVDRKNGSLLGAELIAPEAEHLAHLLAWSISMDMKVNDLLKMPFYHPALEEGLRQAIRNAAKKIAKPPVYADIMRCDDTPVQ